MFDELEASINEGADARKAFRKSCAELLRVYGFYRDLSVKAQNGNEKAMLAVVSGRLQIHPWTDQEGNKRYNTEIVADGIYFGMF